MIAVEEREYARLLGYPWGTSLEGDVLERAEQAAEWYELNAEPRVYRSNAIVAITAGHEVDEEVQRLWNLEHVDEAYFLDRYAAAIVEQLAAAFAPFESPGAGSMPFEEQFRLFACIEPLNPEIEILPSGMLSPKNSILLVPSFRRRGGRDFKKMDPFLEGADGVVRNFFTTPSAPLRMLRHNFLMAQPPLLQKEGTKNPCYDCHLPRCSFRRTSA